MVVHQNDGGGTLNDSRPKDFAWMDHRCVESATRYHQLTHHDVLRIEQQDPEFFLLGIEQRGRTDIVHIARPPYARALACTFTRHAPPKLEGSPQAGSDCRADAGHTLQF